MKLSVSVSILFGHWGQILTKEEFANAMETVKKAGYDGIEFLDWWKYDLDAIVAKRNELGLEVATIMMKNGTLGDPKEKEPFLDELRKSIDAAHKLGCKNIICGPGHTQMFLSEQTFWVNMIECFKEAGKMLESEGITLLIEPVNVKVDHAGLFLSTSKDAFLLARILDDPNIKILFDIYHQQITDGNILETIRTNIQYIGHFHAAGMPGRAELEYSELDYGYVRREIDKLGFDGFMGMEYSPTMDCYEGLVRTRELLMK